MRRWLQQICGSLSRAKNNIMKPMENTNGNSAATKKESIFVDQNNGEHIRPAAVPPRANALEKRERANEELFIREKEKEARKAREAKEAEERKKIQDASTKDL